MSLWTIRVRVLVCENINAIDYQEQAKGYGGLLYSSNQCLEEGVFQQSLIQACKMPLSLIRVDTDTPTPPFPSGRTVSAWLLPKAKATV